MPAFARFRHANSKYIRRDPNRVKFTLLLEIASIIIGLSSAIISFLWRRPLEPFESAQLRGLVSSHRVVDVPSSSVGIISLGTGSSKYYQASIVFIPLFESVVYFCSALSFDSVVTPGSSLDDETQNLPITGVDFYLDIDLPIGTGTYRRDTRISAGQSCIVLAQGSRPEDTTCDLWAGGTNQEDPSIKRQRCKFNISKSGTFHVCLCKFFNLITYNNDLANDGGPSSCTDWDLYGPSLRVDGVASYPFPNYVGYSGKRLSNFFADNDDGKCNWNISLRSY